MAEAGTTLYWLETWCGQISSAAAGFISLCGIITLFAAGASCKFAGILQIVAGLFIVAVEAPNFLGMLAFAAPAGAFFEGKPTWMKIAVYGALTIVPLFAGCFKTFIILGFLASGVVTAIHAFLLFGRRPPSDDLRFQGGPTGTNEQPYSPTSP